jgi:ribosomal protein S27AE
MNEDDELKETKLRCSKCGYINIWKPTIWSYVPHEPKPLTCPKCGSIEWDDFEENEEYKV